MDPLTTNHQVNIFILRCFIAVNLNNSSWVSVILLVFKQTIKEIIDLSSWYIDITDTWVKNDWTLCWEIVFARVVPLRSVPLIGCLTCTDTNTHDLMEPEHVLRRHVDVRKWWTTLNSWIVYCTEIDICDVRADI